MLGKFNEFAQEMLSNNSRIQKEKILEKYKNSYTVKYLLNFIYNPFITTGISEKKYDKILAHSVASDLTNIYDVCEYVKINNTGTDNVLKRIKSFVYSKGKENKELIKQILTKNLQLGITSKTINKIIPDLIPTFNVQLAHKYFENIKYVEGKEFIITKKIDGNRIIVIKEKGNVKFFARSGKEIFGLKEIEEELRLLKDDNFILDGEIVIKDDNLPSKEKYAETMKKVRKDGDKSGVYILAFDVLPLKHFKEQLSEIPYYIRRKKLQKTFCNMNFVSVLPVMYDGTDTKCIFKFLQKMINENEEGIMINIKEASYKFKRTKDLLKVKTMNDTDLYVTDLEEGVNRNKNKLGAFIVDYKGNKVKVGSGITDELREKVWKDKDKYIGAKIEVQYFEETKNQNGGISLRFPVFKDFKNN